MKAQPARLAEHGTTYRAAVCSDACPQCRPVRERLYGYVLAYRARLTAASREGKSLRKRGSVRGPGSSGSPTAVNEGRVEGGAEEVSREQRGRAVGSEGKTRGLASTNKNAPTDRQGR